MAERANPSYQDVAGQEAATQPRRADDSIGELVKELSSQTSTLMRQEVALAKTELKQEATEFSEALKQEAKEYSEGLKQEARKAGKASGLLAGGGLVGFVAFIILMMAASWGLAAVLPTGWAFAIVGVVLAIVAAVIAAAGRKQLKQLDTAKLQQFDTTRLKQLDPKPHHTMETLKEDKEWARNQVQ